jgi:murein DD-endopeptidase MepM/ murein hydrolase activator NlpD
MRIFSFIFLIFAVCFFCFSVSAQDLRYVIIPENPRPGEPVTIGVENGSGVRSAALVVGERRAAKTVFFPVAGDGENPPFLAAVLAIPSTARPGRAMIVLEAVSGDGSPLTEGAAGIIAEIPLDIAGREFESERIALNERLTGIRTDPSPQRAAEVDHLWAILNRTGNEIHSFGSFRPPVTSTRRTSRFGSRRVYLYADGTSDVSIHAGVDYGVPTGTEVSACGPGRVVLARYRIVTGNSVIIEHLPGIYSIYYHLESIAVTEGSLVAAGTLLGLSGATGLATGPHLHWEIRVFGENTDPDAFIDRPILDTDAIFSKMTINEH